MNLHAMKLLLFVSLVSFCWFGYAWIQRPIKPAKMTTQVPVADIREAEATVKLVEQCRRRDLAHFHANWPRLNEALERHSADGSLRALAKPKQLELWDELAHQCCRHPSVMQKHGDGILDIMYSLDLPDKVEEFQSIYPPE